MENLTIFLQISLSGLIMSLAVISLGFVVFKISKSNLLASLVMISFYLVQLDPLTVFSLSFSLDLFLIVIGAYLLNILFVLVVGNIIFTILKSTNFESKPTKKSCKNKYPRVTTKNKFNKRSLYRLAK